MNEVKESLLLIIVFVAEDKGNGVMSYNQQSRTLISLLDVSRELGNVYNIEQKNRWIGMQLSRDKMCVPKDWNCGEISFQGLRFDGGTRFALRSLDLS